MENLQPAARSAIVGDADWQSAVDQVLEKTRGVRADVGIVFASEDYAEYFPNIVRRIRQETGVTALVGCSGQGIIGSGREMEDIPSLSLLTLGLPGSAIRSVRFTQHLVEACENADDWREHLALGPDSVNALLVFADQFHMDCEGLVDGLALAYPERPLLGGLASAGARSRRTFVFLDDDVYDDGGVGLAIGGNYGIVPLVSQGCEPIGETWTITGAHDNVIETISGRPAFDVLVDTFRALPIDVQRRAQRNLLVGLAANEYRDDFQRGDFVIRSLIGIERQSGALTIAAVPHVGQTVQFQIRDAVTADSDLMAGLEQVRAALGDRTPVAAVLCSCNGRGVGLFGTRDHDADAIAQKLGPVPLAGLFCSGEIGPVGSRPFLHGFTASVALLTESAQAT